MSAPAHGHGRLVLVPNTLDLGTEPAPPITELLPAGVIARAASLRHWVVENAKTARAFLKRVQTCTPLACPLQEMDIRELPRPRKGARDEAPAPLGDLLAPALSGHDLGLLSEAGLPAVADPGADLVAAAHAAGIVVEPLPGPSALLLALAASGLNGQSFAFVGYLPQDAGERTARVRELEALSRRLKQTQIAIETPYRNAALLQGLVATLQPTTRLSVACGLTLVDGWNHSGTVQAWRSSPREISGKLPAVFAWLAG